MAKKQYLLNANDDVALESDIAAKQDKITASGILKGNGSGGVSAATADTDYAKTKISDGNGNSVSADGTVKRSVISSFVKAAGVTFHPSTAVPNPVYDSESGKWIIAAIGTFTVDYPNGSETASGADCAKVYTNATYTGEGTYDFVADRDPPSAGAAVPIGTFTISSAASSKYVGDIPVDPGAVSGAVLKMGDDHKLAEAVADTDYVKPPSSSGVSGDTYLKRDGDSGELSWGTVDVSGKLDSDSDADAYDATATYAAGDFVVYNCKVYQAKQASSSSDPHTPVGGATDLYWRRANLSSQFSSDNTSLMGVLPYTRNDTSTLKDRAFNAVSLDGTVTWNLDTELAAVVATKSGTPRDVIVVVTATAQTTVSFTAGLLKGDKPTIDAAGTWIITFTEYAANTWYCRQIKMENAA